MGGAEAFVEVGGAEEEVAARHFLEEEGHVFAAHGLAFGHDASGRFQHMLGDGADEVGHGGIVDGWGVEAPIVEAVGCALHVAAALDDGFDAIAYNPLIFPVKIASRPRKRGLIGNHIVSTPGME